MNKIIFNVIWGMIGGAIFVFGAAKFSPDAFLGNFIVPENSDGKVIERVIKEEKIVSTQERVPEKVSQISKSLVLIQTFQGGKLARYGSGIVLTPDGIIVTSNNVVSAPGVIQVFTESGIFRAEILSRDLKNNLALIKVAGVSNGQIAVLSDKPLSVGDFRFIVGRHIEVQSEKLFIQQALVGRKNNNLAVLDSNYVSDLSGSVLVNNDGEIQGLVYIDGSRVLAVDSSSVKTFFNSYITK